MQLSLRNLFGGAGALIFFWAGFTMLGIRSVSGDSVAEAFYQAFGLFSIGLGAAMIALFSTPFTRDQHRKSPRQWKRCPDCAEVSDLRAHVCPFCRHEFARTQPG